MVKFWRYIRPPHTHTHTHTSVCVYIYLYLIFYFEVILELQSYKNRTENSHMLSSHNVTTYIMYYNYQTRTLTLIYIMSLFCSRGSSPGFHVVFSYHVLIVFFNCDCSFVFQDLKYTGHLFYRMFLN